VINLKQQIWLFLRRITAALASIRIPLFDTIPQGPRHQSTLACYRFSEFNFIAEIANKSLKVIWIELYIGSD